MSLITLFSQTPHPYGIGEVVKWFIIAIAVLAVAYIVVTAMKVPVPPWVWQIIGVILVAAIGIVAINFLLSL